jgi:spore coat-associated protein N
MAVQYTGSLDAFLQATLDQQLNKEISVDAFKLGYIAYKYKEKPSEEMLRESQLAFEELFDGTTNERAALASNVKEVVPGVEMIYGFVNTEEHQIKELILVKKQ